MPAFDDTTRKRGNVLLSGPRSGCTESMIVAGVLLNVPYFSDGCPCNYPLPSAMALVATPESHEPWSLGGSCQIDPGFLQRVGLNFGAPRDRVAGAGRLCLDNPSVGGPSPTLEITESPREPIYRYHHSLWLASSEGMLWVTGSMAEGLTEIRLHDLKSGSHEFRLFFSESDANSVGDQVQDISVQCRNVIDNLDTDAESDGTLLGLVCTIHDIPIATVLQLNLRASKDETLLSGIEVVRTQ